MLTSYFVVALTVPELLAEEYENEFNSAITLSPNSANADVFPVVASLHLTGNMSAFAGYLPLSFPSTTRQTQSDKFGTGSRV